MKACKPHCSTISNCCNCDGAFVQDQFILLLIKLLYASTMGTIYSPFIRTSTESVPLMATTIAFRVVSSTTLYGEQNTCKQWESMANDASLYRITFSQEYIDVMLVTAI